MKGLVGKRWRGLDGEENLRIWNIRGCMSSIRRDSRRVESLASPTCSWPLLSMAARSWSFLMKTGTVIS